MVKEIKSYEPFLNKYLYSKAIKTLTPIEGAFELSPCCNLNCRMCYVRKSRRDVDAAGGEIPADKWIELGRECAAMGLLVVLFTGGEPFLFKDFLRVYTAFHSMGMQITINTNGTLITDDDVALLKGNGPYKINITLYGAGEESYERLCGDGSAFEKVIKNTKKLVDAGLNVCCHSVITPYNSDDFIAMYDIAEKLGVPFKPTMYSFPPVRKGGGRFGEADRFDTGTLSRLEIASIFDRWGYDGFVKSRKEFLERIEGDAPAGGPGDASDGGSGDAAGDAPADEKLSFAARGNEETANCERCENEPLFCRAGRASYWINWRGEMTPCGMMDVPVAYPFKDGFKKAWEQTVEATKKIHMPAGCTACPDRKNCTVCGASVYTETGGYDRVPEYLCEYVRGVRKFMEDDPEKTYADYLAGKFKK